MKIDITISVRKHKMMVMPSNNSSAKVHYWAGKYEGQIGWLVGPTALPKTKLRKWMPFALDNDAFSAWTQNKPWDQSAWLCMMDGVVSTELNPRWTLVPDKVADRDETLRLWDKHSPLARRYGWPLAFAVQDGMSESDIPSDCDVIFVGGTTDWKWDNLPVWCATGKRIHVGRVNSAHKLLVCEKLGVESVDGTGWMRGTIESRQATDLQAWLEGERNFIDPKYRTT